MPALCPCSYQYGAVLFPTTLLLEHHMDVMMASSITCAPSLDPVAPLTVAITAPTSTASELEADLRLARIVGFGVDLMLSHPAFARSTDCVRRIKFNESFYAVRGVVSSVSASGDMQKLTLSLAPVHSNNAFSGMRMSFEWDPNPHREITRRLAAGVPLGRRLEDAIARITSARQLPVTTDLPTDTPNFAINWDPVNNVPLQPSMSILDGALACTNCYMYLENKLSVTASLCFEYYIVFEGTTTLDTSSEEAWGGHAPDYPDCATLGVPLLSSGVDEYDFGFNIAVDLTGGAGFNFQVSTAIPSPMLGRGRVLVEVGQCSLLLLPLSSVCALTTRHMGSVTHPYLALIPSACCFVPLCSLTLLASVQV